MSRAAAKDAVDGVAFEVIGEALVNGQEARILGLRSLPPGTGSARTARNPRTGENMTVAASTVPAFKAGKPFKDAANPRTTA